MWLIRLDTDLMTHNNNQSMIIKVLISLSREEGRRGGEKIDEKEREIRKERERDELTFRKKDHTESCQNMALYHFHYSQMPNSKGRI